MSLKYRDSSGTETDIAGLQGYTMDSEPTSGSTNPVTSGGIYDALDGKQDTLTFDTTPTSGSTNPVTSGGVNTAISSLSTPTSGSYTYTALSSSISLSSSYLTYYKCGNQVQLLAIMTVSDAVSAWTDLFQITSSSLLPFVLTRCEKINENYLYIDTDGTVVCHSALTAGTYSLIFTYFVE